MPPASLFEDEYYDILSKARTGLGLEYRELSKHSGLDSSDIRNLEAGVEDPDPDRLSRLAACLGLAPARLVEFALRPGPIAAIELPPLSFRLPPAGSFAANTYIFSCPHTRACAIVDPGAGTESIRRLVEENGLRPACILVTHGHADHVGALPETALRFGVRAVALEKERPLLNGCPVDFVGSGQPVEVGKINVVLLEVPGHTPGGAAISVPTLNMAFSGDSLFARSVGRCPGPAGVYRRYLQAIRDTLLELPPSAVVCPGHGPLTRVRDEQERNPFLP